LSNLDGQIDALGKRVDERAIMIPPDPPGSPVSHHAVTFAAPAVASDWRAVAELSDKVEHIVQEQKRA
jgi:hypothetical protein